ncbi:MAG: MATE family efflux transporter [Gammaproteobacteria bacterium]|nr:MATE family efflux transporter [Gammaproteobacteria bacterium]MCY4297638.1 MATE family efflux transporter [Gammaproteobacteria bacterium]
MLLARLRLHPETFREMVRIAIPMVVSQGTFALMIFTDRYFLSQVSSVHMAAGLGGGVGAFFSFCFFTGLFSYSNALTAQYFGAGEFRKCPKVLTQGLIMSLASLAPLAFIAWLVLKLFNLLDHDPELVELERVYYLILMAGALLPLAKTCFSSYFAGIGQTRVVMICDVCGLLLNVPLAYVMIFGHLGLPAMGIAGAAISTNLATLFSLGLFLFFYLRRSHRLRFRVMRSFHYDAGITRRYLRLGLPSAVELFLNVAAFNLFLLMFQSYGVVAGASAAIVFNWDILSFVPMIGLNIAVISLIGRYVGAGDMARTGQVIRAGFVIGLCYSATLALIYVLFRFPLVELFAPPGGDFEDIRALAAFMMIGLSCYTMADATCLVAGGVLRGAGDTRWLMLASVSLHWAMLVIQYFVIMVWNLSAEISWIIFTLLVFAIAIVYASRLQGGHWRSEENLAAVMSES